MLAGAPGPIHEDSLSAGQRFLDACDAQACRQSVVATTSDEIDLVTQILQIVVHGRGRQEQDFRLHPRLDHVFHKALVAALPDGGSRLISLAASVVSEVVGLVDHHKIVSAPVDRTQIYVARATAIAG